MDSQHLLDIAAAAEGDVRHPIADALRPTRRDRPEAEDSERSEKGVAARLGEMEVRVGNAAFLLRHGAVVPPGSTGTHVALDGRHAAEIEIADALRPEAGALFDALQARGHRILVASGDTPERVSALAPELGLAPDVLQAGLTPEGKVALLRTLPGPVAFDGDGLNNASAIAAADVVLSRGGLGPVLALDTLSRRTAGILRQKLVFACLYNAGAFGFAVVGAVPPLATALAMAASSACVVINAARHYRPARRATSPTRTERPAGAAPPLATASSAPRSVSP